MKRILLISFVILGFLHTLRGQGNFTPERFTNRPLTLFNDATSVGWNPALLGIGTQSDLVLVLPYTRNFAYDNQVGGFYSQDGVGFGLISDRSAQFASPYIPFSFYWGLGFTIIEDNTWLGGSFRYSEFGTNSIRFHGSFIHKPIDPVLISGGISNMHSVNADNLTYNFSLAYSVTQWLQLLATYALTSDTLIFGGEQRSAQIGVSASTLNRNLVTSFMVNPVLREARFGIEFALGGISLGLLNDASTLNSPGGRFTGGNMLLRYQPHYHEHEDTDEPLDQCTLIDCPCPSCPGRKCTRAGQYSYRCIREHCPGIGCDLSINCDHIGSDKVCQPRCIICFHPIIFNWNVNVFINNTCLFCSCTHYSHYYFYIFNPVKYITIHDTVKVIEYIQECPPCKHECPPCKHECPPCPPNPCKKDTVYITNTVWKDTCIQKPTIIPPPPIIIEGCEFPYNECYPYDECMPKIQDLIQFMLSHPDTCIIMTAHTDSIGTEADNLKLSQCRADAMKELLVQAGIDEERIIPIGKGESEPIDSNSTPEGRRRNRRVEYTFFSCPKEAIEEGQGWED